MNEVANSCYKATFNKQPSNRSIANLKLSELEVLAANCWVMSPPCQPFTRGGRNLDNEDSRSAPLLHLIALLSQLKEPPRYFVLENVKNFETSICRFKLVDSLKAMGYSIHEFLVSPWQFGIPNQRLRYYLLAEKNSTKPSSEKLHTCWPLIWSEDYVLKPAELAICSQASPKVASDELSLVINTTNHGKDAFLVPQKYLLKSHRFRFGKFF